MTVLNGMPHQRRRRGAVLLLALAVLLVLSTLAVTFVQMQNVERRAASSFTLYTRARLAAEAGIQRSMAAIYQHAIGGTINGQTVDWRYFGEDANRNGIADSGEDTNGDGVVSFEGCAVEDATAPSLQVTGKPYSGTLPVDAYTPGIGEITYTLKLIDASNRIDLNWGTKDDVGKILDNLGVAIDPLDPPILSGEGTKIVAYRDTLPNKRFITLADLRDAVSAGVRFISEDDFNRLEPYLTVDAWKDPTVLYPKMYDNATTNDPDTYKDDIFEANLVSRAPVNLNFAPREVLQAIIAKITASYVTDFDTVTYPNVPGSSPLTPQNDALDPATGAAYDSASVVISTDEAKKLAEKIVDRRLPINGGSFTDWSQFFTWMSSSAIRATVFTGSEALTFLKCDVVLANLNPNTDCQRFNPNRTWASLNRKNSSGKYVFRGCDKWNLKTTADAPGWTTEGSFMPTGMFSMSSLGRVTDRVGNIVAEYKITATVRAYEIFRLDNQYDFEGVTGTATHRSDILLKTRATKTRIDSYPEFDPQSWALTGVPQAKIDPITGASTSLSTSPAIYDGQLMLACKTPGVGGSFFYLSFRPDKDGSSDDLLLDYGSAVGYFTGDKIVQRSVIAPETISLVAGSRNGSGSGSISIPRFEWNSNVLPDGCMFVSRRHLAYGGGTITGSFSVQFWGKLIYQADDDKTDDLILSPKTSSDPLYKSTSGVPCGFYSNSKATHEPTLFVDFTMTSTGSSPTQATILSFWVNYDTSANNAQFIVQRSGTFTVAGVTKYDEWHSAFHAPALDRGVWYHFGLLAAPTVTTLIVNSTVNVGAVGSTFVTNSIYSTNWGHFYPVHKLAMAYATMDEMRIWPSLRTSTSVIADYLDGRYESDGTWISPKISFPAVTGFPSGEKVTFLNANWTEHLPDGITSDIELTFDVYDGGVLKASKVFSAPGIGNNVLTKGDEMIVTAKLSASSSSPLVDTPVLNDISVTFLRGETAKIIKWETFAK